MLLYLWLVFLAISIILIIIGFAFDIVIFTLIGSTILFGAGLMMLNEPIQYTIGENIDLNYGTNLSASWDSDGGSIPSNNEPYVFSTNYTGVYDEYDDANTNRYGFLISALGVFTFLLALFMI